MKYILTESKFIKKYDPDLILKNFKSFLNRDEMINFMLDNKLRDSSGELDYNDIKEISGSSENGWKLEKVKIGTICDWIFEKPYKTNINIPPIVYNGEVLDGKTRLGYLNFIGIKDVVIYNGVSTNGK